MTPYYQDEAVTIFHGDQREIVPTLGKVDAIVTDPPFLAVFGTTEDRHDLGNYLIAETWMETCVAEWSPIVIPGGHLVLCCDWRTYPIFWRAVMRGRWEQRNLVVWSHMAGRKWGVFRFAHQLAFVAQKPPSAPRPAPGGHAFDIWTERNVLTAERSHPTEKPVSYMEYLIDGIGAVSVLDPFMGSGTTLRAAKNLGLTAVGIELDERYCEVAANRLAQEVLAL